MRITVHGTILTFANYVAYASTLILKITLTHTCIRVFGLFGTLGWMLMAASRFYSPRVRACCARARARANVTRNTLSRGRQVKDTLQIRISGIYTYDIARVRVCECLFGSMITARRTSRAIWIPIYGNYHNARHFVYRVPCTAFRGRRI